MFAYCNNNPVVYADYFGGAPNIIEYYQIHKRVQERVANEYGFAIEVRVDCSGRTGYLDVYDPYSNSYYEVKSVGQADKWLTGDQKSKYESSYITDWRFRGDFNQSPVPGNLYFEGEFDYKNYRVEYETRIGPGSNELIVYTVSERTRQSSTASNGAGIALAAGLGIAMTGGLGMMLPGSVEPFRYAIK